MPCQVQYQLAKGYEEDEAWERAHAFTYNHDMADVPAAVEAIRHLQVSRGWPRTYLVGFSNGAVVATAAALTSRVDGVWLASGARILDSESSPRDLIAPLRHCCPSGELMLPATRDVRAAPQRAHERQVPAACQQPAMRALVTLGVPVAVSCGDRERFWGGASGVTWPLRGLPAHRVHFQGGHAAEDVRVAVQALSYLYDEGTAVVDSEV